MTQQQDDPTTDTVPAGDAAAGVSVPGAPTAEGPAGDKMVPADEGTASEVSSDSYTLAGPGSDPAAPAVQPAGGTTGPATTGSSTGSSSSGSSAGPSSLGIPAGPAPSGDYDKYGVPTLDFVRDKIEARYAASLGAEELARQTGEAKSFEQRAEERAKAAEAALDEIRKSLRDHRQS